MTLLDPAAALNGVGTGHICDRCNRGIQHGDKAGLYATRYEGRGWTPRRTWCMDCCPEEVDPGTDGADEAILVGVFFAHRLVSVTIRDRSHSTQD
jgi:hypothetical protein